MDPLSEESVGSASDGGHYVLLELAQGGTANVVLAVLRGAQGVDKLVVLKILKPSLADPDLRDMFISEARFSARLNHANIVQTSGIIETPKGPAIVMEYLEGQSVAAILSRARTKIPLAMHLHIIVEALRGLHYAHELTDLSGAPLNVVHRDVSPQNVFVTYDGQIKLIDFGIAKLAGSAETMTGVIKGKMRYMPCEQLEGGEVDRRADVYAAGVMLWEAATRERMWKGESDVTIMRRVLNGEVPSPRATSSDVPDELERIILKALAHDREERYATAAELEADVEAFLAGSAPVTSREIGKFVAHLFEEVRAETKRLIGVQLNRRLSIPPSSQAAHTAAPRSTHSSDSATGSTGASSLAAVESRSGPKSRPTKRLLVMGALALLVGTLGWRLLEPTRAAGRATVGTATAATSLAPTTLEESPAVPAGGLGAAAPIVTGSQAEPVPALLVDAAAATAATKLAATAATPRGASRVEHRPPPPPPPPVASTVTKAPREGCDPPYTIDAEGNKHFKLKCL